MSKRRADLLQGGLEVRVAAFSSPTPSEDIARLANKQDVDILLMSCPAQLLETGTMDPETTQVLTAVPAMSACS